MSCAKCRQCAPFGTDTWCIGCSAWEALGTELCGRWYTPGLRALANDQVVSAVKSVRALRSFSASLQSAGSAQAALRARSAAKEPEQDERAPLPRSRERDLPAGSEVKRQPASSEDCDEESGESSEAPGVAAKSAPDRRPSEPANPPRPREPEGERDRGGERERTRPRSEERGDREGRKRKGNKDRRGNRAGRKRPRLHRAVADPTFPLHRKPPGSYWDQPDRVGDLGDHRRSRRDDER